MCVCVYVCIYIYIYIYIYIVITVSFSLVFVCLVSTGLEHVDDNRGIYLSKAQNHITSFQIIDIQHCLNRQKNSRDALIESLQKIHGVWVRWYFAEQRSFCDWGQNERGEQERERERERGRESVSSALVFSPSFRRAVPACCTELQENTSTCISALCTTYRSDCVGCSVGTAATVYTSFFSEWHKSAPQLAFVPV